MRGLDEARTWEMVAMGSAAAAAVAARVVMRGGWKLFRRSEPPENPAARSVDWREALAWTIVTGIVVGLMRLFAERGAAAGWKRLRGEYPRGLE